MGLITFRHVPFDVNELARIVRASSRPYAEEAISIYRGIIERDISLRILYGLPTSRLSLTCDETKPAEGR